MADLNGTQLVLSSGAMISDKSLRKNEVAAAAAFLWC